MINKIKYIGFDADDTLWVNEPYFKETEDRFCELLLEYESQDRVSQILFETEMRNLPIYGFGAKAFMLSMIETALVISDNSLPQIKIKKIIELGKGMLNKPVHLIDGVKEVIDHLSQADYKLIVATKGDLLDQERKLEKSGLERYFHHIEIMSDKKEAGYQKLLNHLEIKPDEFLMIGNSFKSDISPVLNIGGYGIHVPYHITWQHELASDEGFSGERFRKVESISEVLGIISVDKKYG